MGHSQHVVLVAAVVEAILEDCGVAFGRDDDVERLAEAGGIGVVDDLVSAADAVRWGVGGRAGTALCTHATHAGGGCPQCTLGVMWGEFDRCR